MRGYVDTKASEIVAGDTIIDPITGVLCKVESVDPVNAAGIVTLHMRGSVRRSPRSTDLRTADVDQSDDGAPARVPLPLSQRCPCGLKSRASCQSMCLKG